MPKFDTHVHLADSPLIEKIDDLIESYRKNDIWVNIIGTSINDSKQASLLTAKYEHAFASVGIHPTETYDLNLEETMQQIEDIYLSNKNKIVAIGECGLDYYYPETNKDIQKTFFIEHIKLSIKYDLPLMLHIREAHEDALEILGQYPNLKNVIIHCYTDNLKFAKEYESRGYYISFPGIITFKNASALREVVENIDINQILSETDGPWLSPEPVRGSVNESNNLTHINKKIAEIKNMDIETIEKFLFNNACTILKLKQQMR
ncbi:MAG: TatD family hydrolase [Mycoplasma sp.]